MHRDVGISSCGSANRTGRGGCIRAKLDLVRHQRLYSTIIHKQHDHINGLTADLQSKSSAAQSVERRSAPTLSGAASNHALTVLRSNPKSSFQHGRNDSDALSMSQYLLWDALIGSGSDFVQDDSRFVEPLSEFCTIAFTKAHCGQNHGSGDNGD